MHKTSLLTDWLLPNFLLVLSVTLHQADPRKKNIAFHILLNLRLYVTYFLPQRHALKYMDSARNKFKQEERGQWSQITQFTGVNLAGGSKPAFPVVVSGYLGYSEGHMFLQLPVLWWILDPWILTCWYCPREAVPFSLVSLLPQGRKSFGWPFLRWRQESHFMGHG